MKFVIIFGPQAVGKMTVGHELEKITDLRLFHNHMTIELVTPFFDYGSETGRKLVREFRRRIFEEVAGSDGAGMIFTYVWNFDQLSDGEYVQEISGIFEREGATVCLVELEADMEERLKRNRHPHRLSHKLTKRNIEKFEVDLKASMHKHRLNSDVGEIKHENYLNIDNTHIEPDKVARRIKEYFQL